MAKNDKSVKRGVYLYIDGKQIKNDVGSIKAEIKKLTNELKDMTIGSREYVEQMAKIRNLNSMLKEHQKNLRGVNKEVRATSFSFGKFVDGFNRFGGFIASVVASLTGLVLGLKALRDEKNKLEDSQANLKALTGLDDTSVDWLTKQAQKLSTTMTKEGLRVRQSAAEILDAYMLVGSAKAELLGSPEALAAVTEEAMRLQAAAGDITLAEAVDAVTLSLNQFGAPAEDAARYVNVLAAGSKEGASGIASITSAIKRAGVAAAGANVSVEETVALVETLAYKGIVDEVAGTGLKNFFLVLQTGADETNPRVVGLTKALENLKKKNLGAEDIRKMFGKEGYNAAAVILQNTEMVNQLTEAVTDTNIAFEQSAINSDTASARLAQVRNQMKLAGIELIDKLNPAILVSTNAMTYVIKILPGVIDWFKKWGAEVMILSGYFLLLATRVTITNKVMSAYHAILAAGTSIKKGYALAIVAINAARDTSLRGLVNMRNAIRTSNALTRTTTAVITLLKSALLLLTGQLKAARISFQAFTIAARLNPFGVVLTAVTALAVALVTLRKRQDAVATAQQKLQDLNREAEGQMQEEVVNMRNLLTVAEDMNLSYDTRKKALDKLNEVLPEHLANLTMESVNSGEARKAVEEHTKALIRQATIKRLIDRQAEINKNMAKYGNDKAEYLRKEVNVFELLWGGFTKGSAIPQWDEWVEESKLLDAELKKLQIEDIKKTNQSGSGGDDKPCPVCGKKPCICRKVVQDDDEVKKQLQQLELEHGQRISEIKKRYLEDDSMTQADYNKLIQDAELQLLNEKLKVMGLEESQRQQINDRILDMQIKQREELRRLKLDETIETLSANQKKFQLEAEQLAQDYKNRLISREDFLKKLLELQKIYEIAGNTPEVLTPEQQKAIDKYLDKLDEVIDKYKGAAEEVKDWRKTTQENWDELTKYTSASFDDMTKILTTFFADLASMSVDGVESFDNLEQKYQALGTLMFSYASMFGTAVGELLAGSEDSLKDFLKNTVNMVLTAIEQLMVAYIAQTTMREVANKGFIGLATAAAQIAAITAAFETAKAAIGNFYTGGYTPSGDWDKPQGIVHSNEFVANRYAVANPAVRPVLDLIDQAQRSGTIANLTGNDIAAVAGSRSMPVTQTPVVVNSTSQPNERELIQTVRDLRQVINRLAGRLDEPIEAVGVISGRHGWRAKLDEYDKLLNNKSR